MSQIESRSTGYFCPVLNETVTMTYKLVLLIGADHVPATRKAANHRCEKALTCGDLLFKGYCPFLNVPVS